MDQRIFYIPVITKGPTEKIFQLIMLPKSLYSQNFGFFEEEWFLKHRKVRK
jgi:hypothetical protein